jgi:hypothetical protein
MNPNLIRKMRAVHDHFERRLLEAPATDSVLDDDLLTTLILQQLLRHALDRLELENPEQDAL